MSHIRGTCESNEKEQTSKNTRLRDMEEITDAIGRLEKRIDRLEKQGNTRGKEQVCYSCGVLNVT